VTARRQLLNLARLAETTPPFPNAGRRPRCIPTDRRTDERRHEPPADRPARRRRRGPEFSPTERLIWKASDAGTAETFDRFELTADPDHEGAPEHIHDAVDETFFVLEGAFQFKLGDQIVVAEEGTFVFVPRGVSHTWPNAVLRRSRMVPAARARPR
jgi:mannose-6-phosphate isomerase-like protein (cupin superfamily)